MKTKHITAIQPDEWNTFEFVAVDDDTFTDGSWSGCDYRITTGGFGTEDLAVNIHITGRKSFGPHPVGTWQTRAKIEFVKDGEPSTFMAGVVYSDTNLFDK